MNVGNTGGASVVEGVIGLLSFSRVVSMDSKSVLRKRCKDGDESPCAGPTNSASSVSNVGGGGINCSSGGWDSMAIS